MRGRYAAEADVCCGRARHHVKVQVIVDLLRVDLRTQRRVPRNRVAIGAEHGDVGAERVHGVAHAYAVGGEQQVIACRLRIRKHEIAAERSKLRFRIVVHPFDEDRCHFPDWRDATTLMLDEWMSV